MSLLCCMFSPQSLFIITHPPVQWVSKWLFLRPPLAGFFFTLSFSLSSSIILSDYPVGTPNLSHVKEKGQIQERKRSRWGLLRDNVKVKQGVFQSVHQPVTQVLLRAWRYARNTFIPFIWGHWDFHRERLSVSLTTERHCWQAIKSEKQKKSAYKTLFHPTRRK